MNFRQVHLDFHTSEKIDNIGKEFSKQQFQEALKTGHVNSITVFAKCHHGWAYLKQEKNEMHPGLHGFELLKAEVQAAHEIGVKAPIYISAGLDEKMARRHPEWLVRNKDETTTWVPSFDVAGYHKFCMNSPYLDYLAEQTAEICQIMQPYGIDGVFFDIVGVQPCYCQNCIRTLIDEGKDPYDEKNILLLAERTYANYAKRMREAVDKTDKNIHIFHNGGHIRVGRRDLAVMDSHFELESLPTGSWGYDHFPLSARYAQQFDMDFIGMTGKFHTVWGEFGGFKHPNALRYEASLSALNGAKCSIGDQLSPNGKMDMATYRLIGAAYKELEPKEPWLDNVNNVADVGLFSFECYNGDFSTDQSTTTNLCDSGVGRILLEGHYLFDVLDYESNFNNYKVIILPDAVRITPRLKEKLNEFLKNGGKILATGTSGLYQQKDEFAFDFGAKYEGTSKFNPTYFHPKFKYENVEETGYVIHKAAQKISANGGKIYAYEEEPYFNRTVEHFSSHFHTASSGKISSPAMTEGKDGIYISFALFSQYADNGYLIAKRTVQFALDTLLNKSKTLITNLPAQGTVSVMEQRGENRYINHLLYGAPVKRGSVEVIEDLVPVYNIEVSLLLDKKIKNVYLAPQMQNIPFKLKDGRVNFTVDKVDCHQMVVLDY